MTWPRTRIALVGLASVALAALCTGCSAAADMDGDPTSSSRPRLAMDDAPVDLVVDTDLGADDLAALTFLAHHPAIRLRAITISPGGLVDCSDAGAVLGALAATWQRPLPPYACAPGRADGRGFPQAWRAQAARPLDDARPASASSESAQELLDELTGSLPVVQVLALGPVAGVVDLLEDRTTPARVAVTAMIGATAREGDLAEWNAAAAPEALSRLLDLKVPLRIVPSDAVPSGLPQWLWSTPEVRGRVLETGVDRLWDLAAAGAVVERNRCTWTYGTWRSTSDGLLTLDGPGSVGVASDCQHAEGPGVRAPGAR